MGAEAPLRPAPEIVGQSDRGNRENGRHCDADERADERQAQAAVVDGLRPARENELDELAAAMSEASRGSAGRTMLELQLDLLDREALAGGVDRHPRLDPEAHRYGKHDLAGTLRQVALTGERLAEVNPERAAINERAALFARPNPPPFPALNTAIARSASVSTSALTSPTRSASQSSSGPGSSSRSASVSAWPFPRRAERDHACTGGLGNGDGVVAGAVVGDHHIRARESVP